MDNNFNLDENTINKLNSVIKGGNVSDLISQIPPDVLANFSSMMNNNNNPVLNNLIQKAKQGDTKGVEDFARNLFKEQGRDFDKEYSQFKNSFKK